MIPRTGRRARSSTQLQATGNALVGCSRCRREEGRGLVEMVDTKLMDLVRPLFRFRYSRLAVSCWEHIRLARFSSTHPVRHSQNQLRHNHATSCEPGKNRAMRWNVRWREYQASHFPRRVPSVAVERQRHRAIRYAKASTRLSRGEGHAGKIPWHCVGPICRSASHTSERKKESRRKRRMSKCRTAPFAVALAAQEERDDGEG